jgi:pimeloyl-ACP methyl ester carboxylesterase
MWAPQRIALASRVRCIVPDLRGFGESSTDGPHSMDQYADDVAALLDALAIERAVICGLSMGGYIAMALWRRHPARVCGLVLCDTRMTPDDEATRANRNAAIELAGAAGATAIASKQVTGLIGKSSRARHPGLDGELCAMMARQPVAGIVGALGALRDRPDSQETLRSISVPTLVVVGDEDALTPPSDARAMLAALPEGAGARLEIIAGAGHLTCLERPAAVTHALADFLAAVGANAD